MMNSACLLSSAYWAPVQYYAKLYAYPEVWMEAHEHYVKQTWRNRCLIAAPGGTQALTVPVVNEVVTVVNSADCAMPKRTSLPSMLPAD